MILRAAGTAAERRALISEWARIGDHLNAPAWSTLKASLEAEMTAPDIWSRPDRQAIFARLALFDRIAEATRTADNLKARLESIRHAEERTSRDLVARVALQLYLVREGLEDAMRGAPIDVLLSVEPALEVGGDNAAHEAWCARIFGMYRQWAARRHMQFQEVDPPEPGRPAILQICGFGAFRVIEGEAGLHVLELPEAEGGRRVVARVRTAAGPWEEPGPAAAYRTFRDLLGRGGEPSSIVRRYRERPAPLVRCARHGWRTGRLDTVMEGNFDLLRAAAD